MNSIVIKQILQIAKDLDPHRLLLNLSVKINLERSDKYVTLSNVSIYCTWKNIKTSHKINKFQHGLQQKMKSLNYLMDHILYQIFKTVVIISSKSMTQLLIVLQ